jgi:deazaflavin-dependent oxidoreductase (nitroreductase family)
MASWFVKALQVHQSIYERSGGWLGHRMIVGTKTLLLRSVGRRTGQLRTNALTYGMDGGSYLVTASNGGSRRPPAWLLNLQASRDCEIQVARRRIPVHARPVLPDDPGYARMWEIVNKANHGQYRAYQRKTDRPIAIVELTPR